jgi:chemotaxis response regulator CheB
VTDPIKLLIADDHPVVRDGLSSMFAREPEFTVVGEAADGAEAVRMAEALRPDVILMDLRMADMDGVTAIGELAKRGRPGPRAGADDLRHVQPRAARHRGRRHRLSAQGRAAGRVAAGRAVGRAW